MSIDRFFSKKYRSSTYNCAHFACEVWEYLTGSKNAAETLKGFLCRTYDRIVSTEDLKQIIVLNNPESPCIVYMKSKSLEPHVGVFYKNRVLHLLENGVQFQPLEVVTFGYSKVRFIKC